MNKQTRELLEKRLKELEQFECEANRGIQEEVAGYSLQKLIELLEERKKIEELLKGVDND